MKCPAKRLPVVINKKQNFTMKTIFLRRMAALIATGMCILTVQAQEKQAETTTSRSERVIYNNQYMNFDDDSSISPPRTYANYFNGRTHYNITLADGNVIEMYVDGHKIPADSFNVYSGIVTKLKNQIKRDRLQAIEDRKQAERDREQAERDREQAGRDREQAIRDQEQAARDREQSEKDRQQAERDREQSVRDQAQAAREREQAEKDRQQAERDRAQAVRDQEQAVRDRAQAEEDRKQAARDRIQAEEDRKLVDSLKTDLVTEHVVTDKASIRSVVLNEDELVVNGKVQPEELLRKFKTKYIKRPGFTITLGEHFLQFGIKE